MSAAVLRHAGSASNHDHRPGASFGNQQFSGMGNSKLCDDCGQPKPLGTSWSKFGPNKAFYRCPACTSDRATRKAGGAA